MFAETRDLGRTDHNPIRLEGQIRELSWDGESVTIRIHRDRYPMLATEHVRVRTRDGHRIGVRDLQVGDHIRVQGEQRRDHIDVYGITLLRRDERR